MLQCYQNSQEYAYKIGNLTNDPTYAENARKQLEANKPSPKFTKIVSHIEEKYSCSGLCESSLFYFTQSVKNGPPKEACMIPLVDDMGLLLKNLGSSLIVTGILFFF